MEMLSTLWVSDPHDLSDSRHVSSPVFESQWTFTSCPAAAGTWTQQLSPHLQRNKQLQDALLQREEQLARLQEENKKLREFLSSSSLRNLQLKAQKLTPDGRRNLRRTLTGPPHISKQISKRVCRNLMTQFCSDPCSEPNLDLWVLRSLGLKDQDIVETSRESSPEDSFRDLGFGESSSRWTPGSSFSSPVDPVTPSSAYGYCQKPEPKPGLRLSYDGPESPPVFPQNCLGPPEDFTRLTGPYRSDEALILTPDRSGSFFSDQTESCSIKGLCPFQTQDRNQEQRSSHLSSLPQHWTPSGLSSPVSSSSPVPNKPWTSSSVFTQKIPPAGPQPHDPLQVPHRQTDLAFSMSLSPSSSVKTFSFPQGQAFIRRDTAGWWNFTWVPLKEPLTP